MRAVVVDRFGEPDVLQEREWPDPVVAPGEALIEVRRAGVNFGEVMSRRTGYLGVQPPFVPGMEVAGIVRALGEGVDHLRVGDRVCALTLTGGYAELVAVDARRVFPIPGELDWPVAAALPMVLPTAHALLHELGRLRAGDRVLVTAAAGGTGMVVGQMARAAGARAVGVVSRADKVAAARAAFADVVTTAEVAAGALADGSFDVVLDAVGGEIRAAGWRALAPFGTLVAYGNAGGAPEPPVAPAALRAGNHRAAGLSITGLATSHPERLAAIAARAFGLVADGAVDIPIAHTFPLDRAADAHRGLESRGTTGKTVLTVRA
jgi:NADPH2:quinone reductase